MHQKHPSWLLFTWRGNIHSAGSFRRRKQFRNVPTVCTSLLPAHIMSGQIKDFYLFWWEPESETFASVPDSHPVCWFFSPFLFQCKCQTVIFWVMGRSAAPPKPQPPPNPLHFDMSDCAGGSHGSGTLVHPYSRQKRGIYSLNYFLCSLYDWCDSWRQNSLLLKFVTPPSCDHEDNMAAERLPHQTSFCTCFKH